MLRVMSDRQENRLSLTTIEKAKKHGEMSLKLRNQLPIISPQTLDNCGDISSTNELAERETRRSMNQSLYEEGLEQDQHQGWQNPSFLKIQLVNLKKTAS